MLPSQLPSANPSRTYGKHVVFCGICVVSIWAGSGCSQGHEGPGRRAQALALTPDQEWSLGQQAYKEVLGKSKVVRAGPDVERVREIGRRIAKAAEIEPLQREINLRVKGYRWEWEFNLLQSDQVNAFCLPGGKVAVFTGLLPVAENDDQLATVMAHEIAHALAHHGSERIARQQKYEHALEAINGALGNMNPDTRKQIIGLLGAGAQTGSLAYDRRQESEADHIGLFLMTFAGYDPAQAVRFWERMSQKSAGQGKKPEILSDHPSDARRITQIRQWVAHAQAAQRAWKLGRIAPTGGNNVR
jgi:metalloendopeptidase OMA1, mitochondrial